MFESGIYQIVNSSNGKRYVGSAANLGKRWIAHLNHLRRGTHHSKHMQASWNKHGEIAFSFSPILFCDKSALIFFEQRALDALSPEFNVAKKAGNTLGVPCSPEKAEKIAAARRGSVRDRASVEAGAAKRRGVRMGEAFSARLRGNQHAKGHRHTEEWKAAASLRLQGSKRPKSAEHREKIAATLRGRKLTAEHRANVSASMLGKKRGPYKLKRNSSC